MFAKRQGSTVLQCSAGSARNQRCGGQWRLPGPNVVWPLKILHFWRGFPPAVFVRYRGRPDRRVSISLRLTDIAADAHSALECGGSTPPWPSLLALTGCGKTRWRLRPSRARSGGKLFRRLLGPGGLSESFSHRGSPKAGVEPPHSKVLRTAIFMRAAVSATAAKDPGKSTGHLTRTVETPGAERRSAQRRAQNVS